MKLEQAYALYLPWIEAAMRQLLSSKEEQVSGHYGMMQYHMGWLDASFDPVAAPTGKRIRPLLCLLACGAARGDPRLALPAAAGLELLHNFSLIHDDIEDNSPTRRHRPTVWKLFGMPLACNVGDGMFSVAHLAFHRLRDQGLADRIVLEALRIFDETGLSLTEGQFLDMTFEKQVTVSVDDYFQMVAAKTGALLAASPQLGALIAGAPPEQVEAYRTYGLAIGRAFQLQDDVLGIWGDEAVTGKSNASDILSKKKSLPVIYALSCPATGQQLAGLCAKSHLTEDDVPEVLALLDKAGTRPYVEQQIDNSVAGAYAALGSLQAQGDPAFLALLGELVDSLVGRVY
jgi:geranylgeranyl diphosphate synthase, type I